MNIPLNLQLEIDTCDRRNTELMMEYMKVSIFDLNKMGNFKFTNISNVYTAKKSSELVKILEWMKIFSFVQIKYCEK